MYWRGGIGRYVLWISALTATLCAGAAYVRAGSTTAAQALLITAIVLMPLVHETVARLWHVHAPAKLTYFTVILAVPIALGALAIDGIAALETEAKRIGFASAADLSRARDLKLTSPDALATYDQSRMAAFCKDKGLRPPLTCYDAEHRKAARAFATLRHDEAEFEHLMRAALADQRTRFLAADKDCQSLLDRIDVDAPSVMTATPDVAIDMHAALWAARLSARELEMMVERSKPGVSHMVTSASKALETKIAAVTHDVAAEYTQALQAWSQRIVLVPTGWRRFLAGPTSLGSCKLVRVSQAP